LDPCPYLACSPPLSLAVRSTEAFLVMGFECVPFPVIPEWKGLPVLPFHSLDQLDTAGAGWGSRVRSLLRKCPPRFFGLVGLMVFDSVLTEVI